MQYIPTESGTILHRLDDLDRFALPIDFLLPDARLEMLEPARSVLDPWHVDFTTGEILLGVHSVLLRTGGKNILIDTCVGECKERPGRIEWHQRTASGYLRALAAHGLTAGDIDAVMCTHLHADHVGWNTCLLDGRWVPTFPNARYVMGSEELRHWQAQEGVSPGAANHGAYADSVLPVIEHGLVDAVTDGAELAGGLTVLPLPGHSPGHIGFELAQATTRMVFCGDAIHSPVQIYHPDWCSRFCYDADQARATRRALLERATSEDLLLIPAHLRGSLALRVVYKNDSFHPLMQ